MWQLADELWDWEEVSVLYHGKNLCLVYLFFVLILFLSLLLVLGMFLILSNAKITEILQFFGYLGLSYS